MMKKILISTAGLLFSGFMLVAPITLSNTHGEAMIAVQKQEIIQYTNTHGEGM
ncbi:MULTISPECIES: hypothetical protein [Bacillus]|nr:MULTISPECIES: hypothetical protein [Bacillus]WIK98773.1 hypothetical protein QPL86_27745 [Bacillus bombysepticus]MBY7125689.1 hypothetical protein [Bacillus sp. 16GRE42]MCQ6334500.1 hypothetical protein [Bacillus cereus]MCR6850108.1 hypothetical protein [Bacillus sp. IBL03825]MCU4836485.1 hypothetical protein [Bacillus cereus]